MEGIDLNPTEMKEANDILTNEPNETPEPQLEAAPGEQAEHSHDHEHGHDHSHDHGDGHHHEPGPSLNPELMREIEVEYPAEEVEKTYKTVTKRYQKLARIPGFRSGKVPESLVRSKFAKELRQEVLEALVSGAIPNRARGAKASAGFGAATAGPTVD